eukprot:scaffold520_cov271-Chaetoceros_neogracile.AAC.17
MEIKLVVLKSESMALKRQAKDGKGEIRFYAVKEVAAELRFQKQKKKRKRVETEKGEKDRELEEEKQEIRKVKEESAALARTLEDAMKQLEQESRKVKNEDVALAGALFFVMHLNAHCKLKNSIYREDTL